MNFAYTITLNFQFYVSTTSEFEKKNKGFIRHKIKKNKKKS